MPNRSELKVRAMLARATATPDVDVWCLAAICIIGALASIDFAAYFQSTLSWSHFCGQSCVLLMSP